MLDCPLFLIDLDERPLFPAFRVETLACLVLHFARNLLEIPFELFEDTRHTPAQAGKGVARMRRSFDGSFQAFVLVGWQSLRANSALDLA